MRHSNISRGAVANQWLSPVAGIVLLASAMLFQACGGSRPEFNVQPGPEDPLTPARASLASGNEAKAVLQLTAFLRDNPGSILVDEAKYLRGRAHLLQKDRVLAADDFQRVLSDYPQSRFACESSYYLSVAYDQLSRKSQLDQGWTRKAIGAYRGFVTRCPSSPTVEQAGARVAALQDRLAKKGYENGRLYLKLGRPTSAVIYFEEVLEDHPESGWACESSLGLGEAYYKMRRWSDAVEQLQKVVESCDAEEVKEKATRLLARAREAMVGPQSADSTNSE